MNQALPAASPTLVSLDDFRAAAATLRGVAVRTPLIPSEALESRFGVSVCLKPEMLQRGGAFKFRGAYWFCLAALAPEQRAKGLVAPSSGNHGQAVALAARLFGVPATVVMPTTATRAKREGAERLGARVILEGTTTRRSNGQGVWKSAQREGATLVPPFDDSTIIAGQGTIGLEIVEDLPDVELVLVPVGGGGLSAGVAAAVKLAAPAARVIGVEPAGSPKLTRAREAGAPVTIPANPGGLADGLLAVRIGDRQLRASPCVPRRRRHGWRRGAAGRGALPARSPQARGRAERRDHGRGAARGRGEAGRAHRVRAVGRERGVGRPAGTPGDDRVTLARILVADDDRERARIARAASCAIRASTFPRRPGATRCSSNSNGRRPTCCSST